jgi:SHS2 domain-containing protein
MVPPPAGIRVPAKRFQRIAPVLGSSARHIRMGKENCRTTIPEAYIAKIAKRSLSTAMPYTLLDHTADLRIRVTGDDPADLFRNAGLALSDLIVAPRSITPDDKFDLRVDGADPADLMVNYLRELLYLWTGHEKLIAAIDIRYVSESDLDARITVGRYVPGRHEIIHEIKAVTYHQIEVNRTPAGWQAIVVFDI